jgi:hypothetical protein
MERLNPTGGAAGAIGMLLGGGVRNLQEGRGFFEPSNPGLKRVTDVNNILKSVQFDPNNPATYYQQVGAALQEAGYSDLAPMAYEEARKLIPKREIRTVGNQVVDFSGAEPKVLYTGADKESIVKTPADFALTGQSLGIAPKANAADYTSEETQRIQSKILEDKKAQARASATTINTADPGWQVKAVGEVNSQTKENDTQLTYISQAVNTTINRRTPFDQKAFESLVGNVFGGKVRAQAEIERLKNSGTLGQRLDNTLTLFLEGKIGQTTRDNQMEVLLSLYELSGKQRDAIVGQYKGILGAEADKVALTTEQRHPLPPLTGNREYIPMSIVNQYNLTKGQKVKQGNKEFVYNGDGTITVLKKGE